MIASDMPQPASHPQLLVSEGTLLTGCQELQPQWQPSISWGRIQSAPWDRARLGALDGPLEQAAGVGHEVLVQRPVEGDVDRRRRLLAASRAAGLRHVEQRFKLMTSSLRRVRQCRH